MKKKLFFLIFCFFITNAYAGNFGLIFSPSLNHAINDDETKVKQSSDCVDSDVEVIFIFIEKSMKELYDYVDSFFDCKQS